MRDFNPFFSQATYGFKPGLNIRIVMATLKNRGVSVTPSGFIIIKRGAWMKGQKRERVATSYKTYKEALRSLQKSAVSILERSKDHRETFQEIVRLHQHLRSGDWSTSAKEAFVSRELLGIVKRLCAVRCENLFELKAHLKDQTLAVKSVEELITSRHWGASCTKLVYQIKPRLSVEHRRILCMISRIQEKEVLLGRVWLHEIWLCEQVREKTIKVARLADKVKAGKESKDRLKDGLEEILEWSHFQRPFDFRLVRARKLLAEVFAQVHGSGYVSDRTVGLLRKAQWNLRNYDAWLKLADSGELAPRQKQFFAGVV